MTRFGIIVPCYKYGHFLRECVESVLSQSVRDLRVLIVDDASPDDTALVAAALAVEDARVSVLTHETNRGHIASYNEALGLVDCEFSLVLSADDILTPGALDRAAAAFDAFPRAALCFGEDIPFTTGEMRRAPRVLPSPVGATFVEYRDFLRQACDAGHTPIQAPTAIMRASAQRRVGGFLPELPHSGDTEIWLRLAARGGVVRVEAEQAYRRLHATNMSLDYSDLRRIREQERAFMTHLDGMGTVDGLREEAEQQLRQTLGQAAFWLAARGFDAGDGRIVADALEYAREVWPELTAYPAYKRLKSKQRIGIRLWHALHAVIGKPTQAAARVISSR